MIAQAGVVRIDLPQGAATANYITHDAFGSRSTILMERVALERAMSGQPWWGRWPLCVAPIMDLAGPKPDGFPKSIGGWIHSGSLL